MNCMSIKLNLNMLITLIKKIHVEAARLLPLVETFNTASIEDMHGCSGPQIHRRNSKPCLLVKVVRDAFFSVI